MSNHYSTIIAGRSQPLLAAIVKKKPKEENSKNQR
jgi:hypothetical protein